ncbi:hypothetical protein ACJZ2D_010839 [Fusarium nematophilum]
MVDRAHIYAKDESFLDTRLQSCRNKNDSNGDESLAGFEQDNDTRYPLTTGHHPGFRERRASRHGHPVRRHPRGLPGRGKGFRDSLAGLHPWDLEFQVDGLGLATTEMAALPSWCSLDSSSPWSSTSLQWGWKNEGKVVANSWNKGKTTSTTRRELMALQTLQAEISIWQNVVSPRPRLEVDSQLFFSCEGSHVWKADIYIPGNVVQPIRFVSRVLTKRRVETADCGKDHFGDVQHVVRTDAVLY